MKKIIILFTCFFVLLACEQQKNSTVISGNYVFQGNAAVLQTDSIIYGVIINEKVQELNQRVAPLKKQPTDMVKVEIRGTINKDKHKTILWENKVEITEILNVVALPEEDNNNIIKLSE